jgi:hypothetical protein
MEEFSKVAVNALVAVLVGQLAASIFFLFGFVPRVKRVLDFEIPALKTEMSNSFAGVRCDIADLRRELAGYRERIAERIANHEARLDSLEGRSGLDDTRTGGRRNQ